MFSRDMCQSCYKKWLRETPRAERKPWIRVPKKSLWKKAKCHPTENDKGRGLCSKCYQKWYRQNNLEALRMASREKHYKTKYGISVKQKDLLLENQDYKCALCLTGLINRGPKTHVDHDHKTGRVRGILCNKCNWHMQKVDADPNIIERIRAYAN